ncbi:MAG: dihydropteroate synthase [Nitrospirota bacterium]
MLVVADNLNTRNVAYMDALSRRDARALAGMVCALCEAGAEAVNLQCSLDGAGDEDVLPWAVEAVLLAAGVETDICLDSRNLPALKAALPLPKSPPLVNYVSRTEPPDRKALLEAAAAAGASVVLRASREVPPAGLEAKLQIIEELIEAANAADIPNERLYADPSLVHIGRGAGQSHLANSREFVRVLSELVDPPVNTVAWVSNVSSGMPREMARRVDASFLTYLAGAGLDAALVDVLDPRVRQAVYLLRAYRDETVFSRAEFDARGRKDVL